MGLKAFVPDASLYDDLLNSRQIGHGSYGRYIGSNFQNGAGIGSFFRSLFTRHILPIVRSARPHLAKALSAARPSLNQAASAALAEAGSSVSKKLNDILTPAPTANAPQAGAGKRKRAHRKGGPTRKRKTIRLKRVPPFDIPDSF
jgi:hypothetical protein